MAVSAGAQPATHLALRHPERVQALVLITPALHLPPKPGVPPESGPPRFVLDYLLASDFLVWVIAHLVPNLLVRVGGVEEVGVWRPRWRRGAYRDGVRSRVRAWLSSWIRSKTGAPELRRGLGWLVQVASGPNSR
jgi:pimeloyl-ACP methyl ester carboxylesterase